MYRVKRKPVKNAIARVEEAWFEPAYGEHGVWLSRREVRIRTVDEWLEVREEDGKDDRQGESDRAAEMDSRLF